jgi:hypothetical protein
MMQTMHYHARSPLQATMLSKKSIPNDDMNKMLLKLWGEYAKNQISTRNLLEKGSKIVTSKIML